MFSNRKYSKYDPTLQTVEASTTIHQVVAKNRYYQLLPSRHINSPIVILELVIESVVEHDELRVVYIEDDMLNRSRTKLA